jgi:hypothetical protein
MRPFIGTDPSKDGPAFPRDVSDQWDLGICNYATHVEKEAPVVAKANINPLKAAKRAAAGR